MPYVSQITHCNVIILQFIKSLPNRPARNILVNLFSEEIHRIMENIIALETNSSRKDSNLYKTGREWMTHSKFLLLL